MTASRTRWPGAGGQAPLARALSVAMAAALGTLLGLTALPAPAQAQDGAQAPKPPLRLARPMNGQQALGAIADRLEEVAARQGMPVERLRGILNRDPSAWLDRDGRLYYVESKIPASAVSEAADAPALEQAPFPLSQTFLLHSKPGAPRVIYLDFNGHTVTGTAWNDDGPATINAVPYDTDGNPGSFSDAEREVIQRAWQQTANDFAPFDVDVTTEEPPAAAIARTSSSDQNYGTRAVITDDTFINCGCGGIAYVDVFNITGSSHEFYQPAWVFNQNNGKIIGETISHEVGHNLNLGHDGTGSQEYYGGHGSGDTGWGPIMGATFSRELSQWSKGEYPGASNTEDDLALLTAAGTPYRSDDFPATFSGGYAGLTALSATTSGSSRVVDQSGLIERNTDNDNFAFTTGASGTIALDVIPQTASDVNLDVIATLLDSSGNVIATANDTSGLSASINISVAAGSYFLRVAGTGDSNPLPGYSSYGSLGFYRITGSYPGTPVSNDSTPDPFSFPPQTNTLRKALLTSAPATISGLTTGAPVSVTKGAYSINSGSFTTAAGTINNGDTVRLQHTSSQSDLASVTTTLNIGGVIGTFQSTNGDSTPVDFNFTALTNQQRQLVVTSNSVTLSGITVTLPVSITGGSYSINNGPFITAAGSVVNGDTIRLRHTTASADNSPVTAKLKLGAQVKSFASTTGDNTPNSFSFSAQTGVPMSSERTSASVNIAGTSLAVPISVSGGSYSINGGSFTTAPGTISNGSTLRLRHVSASLGNKTVTTTVKVGALTTSFASTTGDTAPNAFGFTAQTNVTPKSTVMSNTITITGISIPAPISIRRGSYSINGGAFTSAPGTISNGNTVQLRQAAEDGDLVTNVTTLTIGGVSGSFSTTTADVTPDAFGFSTQTDVARGSTVTSASSTISGITKPLTIKVGNGLYSINGGPFVSAAGTVSSGDTVRVQHTASSSPGTAVVTTLTVGSSSERFTSVTAP